jgi:S-adenosylmethionine hydrolase
MIAQGTRLLINGQTMSTFRRFYAESAGAAQTLFAVWGSAGFLEIAAFRASAAQALNARRGQSIMVQIPKSK